MKKTTFINFFLLSSLIGCEKDYQFIKNLSDSIIQTCDKTKLPFASGAGTLADPYIVCSKEQLANVSSYLNSNFKMGDNINLQGISFSPIADYANGYAGIFDGNNYSIENWSYSCSNCSSDTTAASIQALGNIDYATGFFRTLENGAVIKNLNLKNVTLKGRYFTGALVGLMKTGSRVENCSGTTTGSPSDMNVTNSNIIVGFNNITTGAGRTGSTGGLVGEMQTNSTISNSSFNGIVRGASYVGGLTGNNLGEIISSSTQGGVRGTDGNIGGIVGNMEGVAIIRSSNSSAKVSGTGAVAGGIAGSVKNTSSISKSSSSGDVTATFEVGGVVGSLRDTATVSKSFSSGLISGTYKVGGFVGAIRAGTISDSYSISNVNFSADTASAGAGGFVGHAGVSGISSISRCYSSGIVTPSSGGLIHYADFVANATANSTITDSYALTSTTFFKTNNGSLNNSSNSTDAELKDSANFHNWDFTTVWKINAHTNNGYPTIIP